MSHFTSMVAFSALVGIVFAVISSEHSTPMERLLYGVKVFFSFVGIGFGIAWLIYFLPR
jgi:hypothetical protein